MFAVWEEKSDEGGTGIRGKRKKWRIETTRTIEGEKVIREKGLVLLEPDGEWAGGRMGAGPLVS